jgi:hypothetical protein
MLDREQIEQLCNRLLDPPPGDPTGGKEDKELAVKVIKEFVQIFEDITQALKEITHDT